MNRAERRAAAHPRGTRTVVRREIPVGSTQTWGEASPAAASTRDTSPANRLLAKLRRRRRDDASGPCHACPCCATWTTALRLLGVEIRAHLARQRRPFSCRADCLVCGPGAEAWLGEITKGP